MSKGEIQILRESFMNPPTHKYMGTFEVPIDEDSEVVTLGSEEDGPVTDIDHLNRDPKPGRLVPHTGAHEYGMESGDTEIMQKRKKIARDLVVGKRDGRDLNIESNEEYTLNMIYRALIYINNNVTWYRNEYEDFNFSVNDPYISRQIDLVEHKLKDLK